MNFHRHQPFRWLGAAKTREVCDGGQQWNASPRGSRGKGEQDPNHSFEFCSGPIAGSIFKSGNTFRRKSILYADVGGFAIFEGDIVVGRTNDGQPSDSVVL